MRACSQCLIKWDIEQHGRSCPSCNAGAFFTMNMGDIGFAIWMDRVEGPKPEFRLYEPGKDYPPRE